jgi:tetratricopeptide (TPR) repeat protein
MRNAALGGIGKTQTAVEYAYRYRDEYHTVLWVRAATKETLISDFVAIAQILYLPEKNEQDQNKVVAAVKQWLATHEKWLLILDNAEDLKIVHDFMPLSETGHILLTTRIQTTGDIATSIEVNKMDEEEGMLLLLRRSKALAINTPLNHTSQEDQKSAQAIVKQVGGLPLALDQAGAYIEETGCSLTDYLKVYTIYRRDLLKRNSKFASHADVATTFTLAFQKVEQTDSAAANLLRFFAFLDPDAIPEEFITQGAPTIGPAVQSVAQNPLKLHETLGLLRNFSLIRRNAETGALAIHRLVQAVIRDDMNKRTQRLWAKRTVKVVSKTFPDVEVANWSQCERCLPHALICFTLIEQYRMSFQEATDLSFLVGAYLYRHSRLIEAESILKRDLEITEKVYGLKGIETAKSLNNLALLYYTQGQYEQVESLYQRALAITEQQLGPDHPDTITTQGNYDAFLNEKKRKRKTAPRVVRLSHPSGHLKCVS